jgi:hypothetical protein
VRSASETAVATRLTRGARIDRTSMRTTDPRHVGTTPRTLPSVSLVRVRLPQMASEEAP